MKQLKYLFLILLCVLILPFGVFAEEDENSEATEAVDPKEVTIYFFRGQGCSHCAEAEAWFDSIEEEYGSKFNIVDYETWYDQDNAELMKNVAKARGEEDSATGVPYIIIADQSWIGFDSAYSDEIISKIETEYEKDPTERFNIMDHLDEDVSNEKDSSASDIVATIIIVIAVAGIGFGVYSARKANN